MKERKIKYNIQSYWIIMCVVLLYEHPCSVALNIDGGGRKILQDPLLPSCDDWQVYDGTECVCASEKTSKCTDKGGIVCDQNGVKYPSACAFEWKSCQGLIDVTNASLQSCGTCNTVRLVGWNNQTLESNYVFKRVGNATGLDARYTSVSNNLELFYDVNLRKWIIGIVNATDTYAAVVPLFDAIYPQDIVRGMLVAAQNEAGGIKWELHPFLRFECVSDSYGRREKRFFFIFAIVLGLAVSAISVALSVVQASKGCLYYPSVCTMREEIKNQLKPEVTGLRDRFVKTYGNTNQFKNIVDAIHDQVLEASEKIMSVKRLNTELKSKLSDFADLYSTIKEEFPDFEKMLSNYNSWLNAIKDGAMLNTVFLSVEIFFTALSIPAMIGSVVSVFAMGAAVVGALASVAIGIFSIVQSVIDERKQRDELQKIKADLLQARLDLNQAFKQMNLFQQKFCKEILRYLYDLSYKGRTSHSTFLSLHKYLTNTFGKSSESCDYRKINLLTVQSLSHTHLKPLITYLSQEIDTLKLRIIEVEEVEAFMIALHYKIVPGSTKISSHPVNIYQFIKSHKPKLANKLFKSYFDLLKYIAFKELPKASCYWGRDLTKIRSGEITEVNYVHAPVCNSSEIRKYADIIKAGVQNVFAPCKIVRRVMGVVFLTTYNVLRFLADTYLLHSTCYWGFNLKMIRDNQNIVEINNAKINSGLFTTLKLFSSYNVSSAEIFLARNTMCKQYKVCDIEWQTFLLCNVWHKNADNGELHCSKRLNEANCIPLQNETC